VAAGRKAVVLTQAIGCPVARRELSLRLLVAVIETR
jgi:hypothetical protein